MIFIALLLTVCTFNTPVCAQGTLYVEVSGIKTVEGTIRVGLFKTEEDFLKNAFQGEVVQVAGDTALVVFKNLPAGNYAVSVIHDENANGKLDSNFFGIPNEGVGFSNNATGTFGPPSFDKAMIVWKEKDMTVSIRLKYY